MLALRSAPTARVGRWFCSVFAFAVWLATASARADAIDPSPIPTCQDGFVVVIDHGGTRCARPSCASTSDCPVGLGCTPRRCVGRPAGCEVTSGGAAKDPPNQCDELEDRGPCSDEGTCPTGELCTRGTCLPPEELAAYFGEEPFEVARAETDAGSPETGPPAVRPGGGCCGSRGARTASAWLLPPLAVGFTLAARRARQTGRARSSRDR